MARMKYLCASIFVLSSSVWAEPPNGDALPAATSPNQSLSIEEPPVPTVEGESKEPIPLSPQSVVVPAPGPAERPRILLGKKPSAVQSSPFARENESPWYRTGLGALAVVLGLIIALYLIVRRWSPSLSAPTTGIVKVIGRTAVGPRQSLVLVQLGPRLVLVGVSSDRLESLCQVTDVEEVARILVGTGLGGREQFSSWLDKETAEFAKAGGRDVNEPEVATQRPKQLAQLLQKLRTTRI